MKKHLVIMAAGLGSRYGGVKQMAGVGPRGEILMEYAIYDALLAGFDDITLVIKPEMLHDCREKFGDRIVAKTGAKINYAFQIMTDGYEGIPFPMGRKKPMGTVHAVLSAKDYIRDGIFAVLNADDYYGRDAFSRIASLGDSLTSPGQAAMVGYRLENTISRFGTVTRGICQMQDGRLTDIRETGGIGLRDGHIFDGRGAELLPDSLVSMNLWTFRWDAMALIDTYFRTFLETLTEQDTVRECLVPVMVADLMARGDLTVRVSSTPGQWFGLTYQEDRAGVSEALAKLGETGYYPEPLF